MFTLGLSGANGYVRLLDIYLRGLRHKRLDVPNRGLPPRRGLKSNIILRFNIDYVRFL